MHLGMERIQGPSGEEKAKLGLTFVLCKLWVEKPSFVLCKEQRVVIKLFFFYSKSILASFLGSSGPCNNKANLC